MSKRLGQRGYSGDNTVFGGVGPRWVNPSGDNLTKTQAPYSYSEFYLWGTPEKGDDAVYSDRLFQWDHIKYQESSIPIGKRLEQFAREDAIRFLTSYFAKPTVVSAMAEGCNVSNGNPYWIFWFHNAPTALNPLIGGV